MPKKRIKVADRYHDYEYNSKILLEYYSFIKKSVNYYCAKSTFNYCNINDLIQYLCLDFLEKDSEKLKIIVEENNLNGFLIMMIKNTVQSNANTFKKTFTLQDSNYLNSNNLYDKADESI